MSLSEDHLKGLDSLRRRLQQLQSALRALNHELAHTYLLPTWPSLLSKSQILAFHLSELSVLIAQQRTFLREAHAYPLPSFPGATHEVAVQTLLRKKLETDVEDWVERYTTKYPSGDSSGGTAKSAEASRQLWWEAGPASNQIVGPMTEEDGALEDEYTIAEREMGVENVRTGLRMEIGFEDESEDEEEEGDGDEDDAMKDAESKQSGDFKSGRSKEMEGEPAEWGIPLEKMLKFMCNGNLKPCLGTR